MTDYSELLEDLSKLYDAAIGHDRKVYQRAIKAIRALQVDIQEYDERETLDEEVIQAQVKKIEALQEQVKELEIDANRYRYLRDEDNWGDDNEPNSWAILGESHAGEFDDVVDARIKAMGGKND